MIKLGKLAAWNLMTKKVIDGTDPTLAFIKLHAPDQFEELMKVQMPTFIKAAGPREYGLCQRYSNRTAGTGGLILR